MNGIPGSVCCYHKWVEEALVFSAGCLAALRWEELCSGGRDEHDLASQQFDPEACISLFLKL